MKLLNVLPFAALSIAFVIPDEEVMSQVAIETKQAPESVLEKLPSKGEALNEFEKTFTKLIDTSKSGFDQAIKFATDAGEQASTKAHEAVFDGEAWLESAANKIEDLGNVKSSGHDHGKPNLTVCFLQAMTLGLLLKSNH